MLEDFFEAGELWLLQVQGVRHGRVHLVLEDGQDVTSAATTVVDLTFLALPGGTLDGYDMALVTCLHTHVLVLVPADQLHLVFSPAERVDRSGLARLVV